MTTSAPRARLVDALTGTRAPTKFFQALSVADEHVALAAELESVRDERDEALVRAQELTAENADLAERLDSLDNAHQITLTELARARNERDSLRCAVTR